MTKRRHKHTWGPRIEVKDKTFGVVFGSYRECECCGKKKYEDRTAGRHGSSDRIIQDGESI